MSIIYGLHETESPEIRYVGKTCDLKRRLKDHGRADVYISNRALNNWLCSINASGSLCAKVLEERPSDWHTAEVRWIQRLKHEGHRLLNLAPGGQGSPGGPLSAEHRARISAAKKGRPYPKGRKCSLDTRAKISVSHMGIKNSPETRAKISVAMKGKKFPPRSLEHCANISAALKGKKRGPFSVERTAAQESQ